MKCASICNTRPRAFVANCIVLLLLCLAAASCDPAGREDKAAVHKKYQGVLDKADSLYNSGRKMESLLYVDSLLHKGGNIPAYGKYICYTHSAHYYTDIGEKLSAISYADSALHILEQHKLNEEYPEDYTHALLDVANILSRQEQYEQALDYFTRAKIFAAAHGNSCGMSEYSYNIAMTLFRQEQRPLAIRYFNEAFWAAQVCERKPWFRMQELLTNIGLSYLHLQKFDSSMFYLDSALSFIDKYGDRFETKEMSATARAVVYRNIGYNYASVAKNDSAIIMFRKCINEAPRSDNSGIAQGALGNTAAIYHDQKKFPEMYATLMEFEKLVKAGKEQNFLNYWQQLMIYYYRDTRQFEKMAKMTTDYYKLKDSIDNSLASLKYSDVEKDVKDKEQQYQISLLKKDNELKKLYLWITVSCSGLFAVIIVLIVFNFRRSRRKSAQIRKQNEELEQLNREKDKILGVVAHDLRNPIGVISYLTDLMIEDDDERPEKEKESLGMVHSASQHSLALINELLELKTGRQLTTMNEQADLVAISRECEGILQFRLKGKDQQIVIEAEHDEMTVQGNSERLSRLMQNLLTNAIKFSYPGSTIVLGLQRKDESILLSVADKGIGIPADIQPDILNAFTGARRRGTGDEQSFGLGLSISKQIVDEHQGKIWFESEEGKGTTFFVELLIDPVKS